MACAVIEAVVDAIEPRTCSRTCGASASTSASTCIVGPVTGHQGAGFLHGLRTSKVPAKLVQKALLDQQHPHRHQRRPERPAAAAALHPRGADVDLLRGALELGV
jgi:hypothetical protein